MWSRSTRPDPTTGLTVAACRSWLELAPWLARMDALSEVSRRKSPFTTSGWLKAQWDHDHAYGSAHRDLCVLLATLGDELIGYLPLGRVRSSFSRVPYRRLGFAIEHHIDRPYLVSRAVDEMACAKAFVRFLVHEDHGWSELDLLNQDDDSAFLHALRAEKSARMRLRTFPGPEHAVIENTWPSLEAWYKSGSKKFRNNVGRLARHLFAAGPVSYATTSDPRLLPTWLDTYTALERRSWKAAAGVAVASHPESVSRYRELLSSRGPVRFTMDLLRLGDDVVAGMILCEYQGQLFALETAYDEEHSERGPGNLILVMMMRHLIERRLTSCALMHSLMYFKSRWQATSIPTTTLQLLRAPWAPFLRSVGADVRDRVQAARRGSPDDEAGEAGAGPTPEATSEGFNQARRSAGPLAGAPAPRWILGGGDVEILDDEALAAALPFACR